MRRWLATILFQSADFLSYQHANDGDEGDNLDDPPEGEEEAAQHCCDRISTANLFMKAN